MWVGTESGGLACYDQASRQGLRVIEAREDERGLTHRSVTSVVEGRNGELWVGTRSGLNRMVVERKGMGAPPDYAITHYRPDAQRPGGVTRRAHQESVHRLTVGRCGSAWPGVLLLTTSPKRMALSQCGPLPPESARFPGMMSEIFGSARQVPGCFSLTRRIASLVSLPPLSIEGACEPRDIENH